MKNHGYALQYASGELKADKEVAFEAVKQDAQALQYASKDLKADKEVVLEAVTQNGRALQCSSLALRNGGLKTYVADLRAAYNTPVATFFLFGSATSAIAIDSFEDDAISPTKTRPRVENGRRGVLKIFTKLGDEGGLAITDIGALPRRCRPFSLTEGGSLKSRAKHNNGVRVPFSPAAHERQCEAPGFMDRRCVGRFERKLRPFAIDYSYIGRAAINSTFTDRLESHMDGNRYGRRACPSS